MPTELQPLTGKDKRALRKASRYDLYTFNRFMFRMMKGFNWLDNFHHKVICDALMDVFFGRRRNLIINIPPRYSKTELAVVAFTAWAIGLAPDAEFIHCSSTSDLAVHNSTK